MSRDRSTLSLFDRPPGPGDGGEGGREGGRGGGRERGGERVLRVAEVNRAVRMQLEDRFRDVWIEGELSDVTRASSGHLYFTLNDEEEPAQLRCVMFRGDARRAKARMVDGARVKLRGGLSLYEPRGSFQMIARLALPAGAGDLSAQLERVRKVLEAEGLLDPARKRPLPRFPRVVGVVTSAAGAALHDIERVARARCPVRLVVADCRVQGDGAPESIVAALAAIQRLPGLDVVIVSRGGGAAEDLWAFNDERVARAIAACRVPTVSGVGHEVDVTIADLIADARAATPSNAAEIVCPDRRALEAEIDAQQRHLERALETRIGRERLRLERLRRGLHDPRRALGGVRRRFEALGSDVRRLMERRLARERQSLAALHARLVRLDPRTALARDRRAFAALTGRLEAAMRPPLAAKRRALFERRTALLAFGPALVAQRGAELGRATAQLEALSPLAVLARGYAIALHERTGKALLRAADAEPGDRISVRLAEGRLDARVEEREDK